MEFTFLRHVKRVVTKGACGDGESSSSLIDTYSLDHSILILISLFSFSPNCSIDSEADNLASKVHFPNNSQSNHACGCVYTAEVMSPLQHSSEYSRFFQLRSSHHNVVMTSMRLNNNWTKSSVLFCCIDVYSQPAFSYLSLLIPVTVISYE